MGGYSKVNRYDSSKIRKVQRLVRESKIKPRFRAECVVVGEESCILESCCLSSIRRNSVLRAR